MPIPTRHGRNPKLMLEGGRTASDHEDHDRRFLHKILAIPCFFRIRPSDHDMADIVCK